MKRLLSIRNETMGWKICFSYISNAVFSTQAQCCLTFSWIEPQMLLKCCLIHITIIILRYILYLVYFCPCLDLGFFMSSLVIYLSFQPHFHCHQSYNFLKQTLVFCTFFRISPSTFGWQGGWRKRTIFKQQMFSLRVLLNFCLFFANFNLSLFIKVLLMTKACRLIRSRISSLRTPKYWSLRHSAWYVIKFWKWVS